MTFSFTIFTALVLLTYYATPVGWYLMVCNWLAEGAGTPSRQDPGERHITPQDRQRAADEQWRTQREAMP